MTDLMEIYKKLATMIKAYKACDYGDNVRQQKEAEIDLWDYARDNLPSGGVIGDANLDVKSSNQNKIVFYSSMDCYTEYGYYAGSLEYKITIKPSLFSGASIKINCASRHMRKYYNDNIDYLYEVYTP